MSHSNIVKYVDDFADANKFFIVMEYADGGDLQARRSSSLSSP